MVLGISLSGCRSVACLSKTLVVLVAAAVLMVGSTDARAQGFGGYEFVAMDGNPHDVIYDAARNLAYVSNRSLNRIEVVAMDTLALQGAFAVSQTPTGMAITPDGSQLLIAAQDAYAIDVVDLDTQTLNRSIAVGTSWPEDSKPSRVEFDAAGRCYWFTLTRNNPYGYLFELDLTTDVSTEVFRGDYAPYLRFEISEDKTKAVFVMSSGRSAVYDAATGMATPPLWLSEFGYSASSWLSQGRISNDGQTILLDKSQKEVHVYDGDFTWQGSVNVGMVYGAFGPWPGREAIIVEGDDGEGGTNRLGVLDTVGVRLLQTVWLPERIGINEYDGGSKPFAMMPDGNRVLAVGQTGLFVVNVDAPIRLNGDADHDGDVDLEDFVILKTNFGATDVTIDDGDFDSDGDVDLNDFTLLKNSFGYQL